MNSRRIVTLFVLGALTILAWWFTRPVATPPQIATAREDAAGTVAPTAFPSALPGDTDPSPPAPLAPFPPPSYTPETPSPAESARQPLTPAARAAITDLDDVQVMFREYRNVLRENPVGTNAEIMSAISGANPRQIKLGPPAGQRLNDKGELLDRWGNPYFFHQLSATRMEIRSAGPNGKMWSADDLQR